MHESQWRRLVGVRICPLRRPKCARGLRGRKEELTLWPKCARASNNASTNPTFSPVVGYGPFHSCTSKIVRAIDVVRHANGARAISVRTTTYISQTRLKEITDKKWLRKHEVEPRGLSQARQINTIYASRQQYIRVRLRPAQRDACSEDRRRAEKETDLSNWRRRWLPFHHLLEFSSPRLTCKCWW
jgi:hypothetical protein